MKESNIELNQNLPQKNSHKFPSESSTNFLVGKKNSENLLDNLLTGKNNQINPILFIPSTNYNNFNNRLNDPKPCDYSGILGFNQKPSEDSNECLSYFCLSCLEKEICKDCFETCHNNCKNKKKFKKTLKDKNMNIACACSVILLHKVNPKDCDLKQIINTGESYFCKNCSDKPICKDCYDICHKNCPKETKENIPDKENKDKLFICDCSLGLKHLNKNKSFKRNYSSLKSYGVSNDIPFNKALSEKLTVEILLNIDEFQGAEEKVRELFDNLKTTQNDLNAFIIKKKIKYLSNEDFMKISLFNLIYYQDKINEFKNDEDYEKFKEEFFLSEKLVRRFINIYKNGKISLIFIVYLINNICPILRKILRYFLLKQNDLLSVFDLLYDISDLIFEYSSGNNYNKLVNAGEELINLCYISIIEYNIFSIKFSLTRRNIIENYNNLINNINYDEIGKINQFIFNYKIEVENEDEKKDDDYGTKLLISMIRFISLLDDSSKKSKALSKLKYSFFIPFYKDNIIFNGLLYFHQNKCSYAQDNTDKILDLFDNIFNLILPIYPNFKIKEDKDKLNILLENIANIANDINSKLKNVLDFPKNEGSIKELFANTEHNNVEYKNDKIKNKTNENENDIIEDEIYKMENKIYNIYFNNDSITYFELKHEFFDIVDKMIDKRIDYSLSIILDCIFIKNEQFINNENYTKINSLLNFILNTLSILKCNEIGQQYLSLGSTFSIIENIIWDQKNENISIDYLPLFNKLCIFYKSTPPEIRRDTFFTDHNNHFINHTIVYKIPLITEMIKNNQINSDFYDFLLRNFEKLIPYFLEIKNKNLANNRNLEINEIIQEIYSIKKIVSDYIFQNYSDMFSFENINRNDNNYIYSEFYFNILELTSTIGCFYPYENKMKELNYTLLSINDALELLKLDFLPIQKKIIIIKNITCTVLSIYQNPFYDAQNEELINIKNLIDLIKKELNKINSKKYIYYYIELLKIIQYLSNFFYTANNLNNSLLVDYVSLYECLNNAYTYIFNKNDNFNKYKEDYISNLDEFLDNNNNIVDSDTDNEENIPDSDKDMNNEMKSYFLIISSEEEEEKIEENNQSFFTKNDEEKKNNILKIEYTYKLIYEKIIHIIEKSFKKSDKHLYKKTFNYGRLYEQFKFNDFGTSYSLLNERYLFIFDKEKFIYKNIPEDKISNLQSFLEDLNKIITEGHNFVYHNLFRRHCLIIHGIENENFSEIFFKYINTKLDDAIIILNKIFSTDNKYINNLNESDFLFNDNNNNNLPIVNLMIEIVQKRLFYYYSKLFAINKVFTHTKHEEFITIQCLHYLKFLQQLLENFNCSFQYYIFMHKYNFNILEIFNNYNDLTEENKNNFYIKIEYKNLENKNLEEDNNNNKDDDNYAEFDNLPLSLKDSAIKPIIDREGFFKLSKNDTEILSKNKLTIFQYLLAIFNSVLDSEYSSIQENNNMKRNTICPGINLNIIFSAIIDFFIESNSTYNEKIIHKIEDLVSERIVNYCPFENGIFNCLQNQKDYDFCSNDKIINMGLFIKARLFDFINVFLTSSQLKISIFNKWKNNGVDLSKIEEKYYKLLLLYFRNLLKNLYFNGNDNTELHSKIEELAKENKKINDYKSIFMCLYKDQIKFRESLEMKIILNIFTFINILQNEYEKDINFDNLQNSLSIVENFQANKFNKNSLKWKFYSFESYGIYLFLQRICLCLKLNIVIPDNLKKTVKYFKDYTYKEEKLITKNNDNDDNDDNNKPLILDDSGLSSNDDKSNDTLQEVYFTQSFLSTITSQRKKDKLFVNVDRSSHRTKCVHLLNVADSYIFEILLSRGIRVKKHIVTLHLHQLEIINFIVIFLQNVILIVMFYKEPGSNNTNTHKGRKIYYINRIICALHTLFLFLPIIIWFNNYFFILFFENLKRKSKRSLIVKKFTDKDKNIEHLISIGKIKKKNKIFTTLNRGEIYKYKEELRQKYGKSREELLKDYIINKKLSYNTNDIKKKNFLTIVSENLQFINIIFDDIGKYHKIKLAVFDTFIKNMDIFIFILTFLFNIFFLATEIPFFLAFETFFFINFNQELKDVFIGIFSNASKIFMSFFFIIILLYFIMWISFWAYPQFFVEEVINSKNEDMGEEAFCYSSVQCLMFFVSKGLYDGGTHEMINTISFQHNPGYSVGIFFYNLITFTLISLIFNNIVTGLIADAFNEKSSETNEILNDINNKCFICDLTSNKCAIRGDSFYYHIKVTHNRNSFLEFLCYLHTKNERDFTTYEKVIWDKLNKNDITWIPYDGDADDDDD